LKRKSVDHNKKKKFKYVSSVFSENIYHMSIIDDFK